MKAQVINRLNELRIFMEKEIVTETEINAPPSRVWQILTDFENYQLGTHLSRK